MQRFPDAEKKRPMYEYALYAFPQQIHSDGLKWRVHIFFISFFSFCWNGEKKFNPENLLHATEIFQNFGNALDRWGSVDFI